jgi:hypothetical protein
MKKLNISSEIFSQIFQNRLYIKQPYKEAPLASISMVGPNNTSHSKCKHQVIFHALKLGN